MLKFITAGESHGDRINGILEGLPANLKIDRSFIDLNMKRRRSGYGRGARMKLEDDRVEIISGIDNDMTTGAPIAVLIENKGNNIDLPEIKEPRPGHADLPGLLKYNQEGARNILERASARETAMRVALGSMANLFLKEFDIEIYSHVVQIGSVKSPKSYYTYDVVKDMNRAEKSIMNVIDPEIEGRFIEELKKVRRDKDSVGGGVEIIVRNLPVGLGSHISWDRRLDGLLSQSIISIPAVKAVEFGIGFKGADLVGSAYHDEIIYDGRFKRKRNNAGGIEGGMSNGEDLVVNISMKPIPTLMKPLKTVNIDSKKEVEALVERADTSAVAAVSVVAESMVALCLANEFLRKFGGDSMEEVERNFRSYKNQIEKR